MRNRPCLRDLIVVQRLKSSATADAAGQIDESDADNWETHCRCYGQLVAKGSREFFAADRVQADVTHRFTTWDSADTRAITSAMRFEYQGRTFNIAGPPWRHPDSHKLVQFDAIEVR